MRAFLHLAFAIALFAAGVASESRGSDLLRITDDGWYVWQVAGDDTLEIYVRIESQRPREFFLPGVHCGRGKTPASTDLGVVDATASIAWLQRFIYPRSDVTTEVLAAISLHHTREATRVLEDIVTSDRDWDVRREAVFWLAQSDDASAFAFLDALLTAQD